MGYQMKKEQANKVFETLCQTYEVFAPKVFEKDGCFTDIDTIRYDKITSLDEIEWNKKSDYSFKEVLLSISETLFYFTEDHTTVPKGPEKEILIFLRSCDLHALKRLDQIYLRNGFEDFYYARVRRKAKFVLMGCKETCDTGFCVSMGTNQSDNYDLYLKVEDDKIVVDCKCDELNSYFEKEELVEVIPDYVTENKETVTLPKNITTANYEDEIFKEYGARCIGCGRCNFVCPTCTCFTMQDIFYKDNEKVGERRRVWASCQVNGFTDMAGGHSFRKTQGERFRFKVLHKIKHYGDKNGYQMCVGCGRCDRVCPEYISFSNCINRLSAQENQ